MAALESTPLLVVIGPTGAGKSTLCVELALEQSAEIINCDSVQVYRQLDIGSGKLTMPERRGVPHYLLDTLSPSEELTAGEYARQATEILGSMRERRILPIIVGGTGFYLRALLDGLSPAPSRDQRMRSRLTSISQQRPAVLHRYLRRVDPASAGRIHPNDHQKLIRAIELSFLAGRPASEVQNLPRARLRGYQVLKLGLNPDRSALHQTINQRTEAMFSNGLLQETEALIRSGFSAGSKPLQSLGYKQAVEILTGVKPAATAIRECQAKTRQYAKRQLTWFRADPHIRWLDGFGTDSAIQARAGEILRNFLADIRRTSE